ncbi:VWA domain-containing protein [soil metagenome]
MPSFAHPWVLAFAPLAVLLVWRWTRRVRPGVMHGLGQVMRGLPAGKSRWVRRSNAWLRGLGAVAVIVALTGPRWPDPGSRYTTQGVALFLILDVSGSMAEPDYTWDQKPVSRLQAAQNVLELFVQGGDSPDGSPFAGRLDDLIGLTTCSTRPEIACPLTLSHDALVRVIRGEQPRRLPQESQTNIGDSVALSLQHLMRSAPKRKAIVLLTDGEHNVAAPAMGPLPAARLSAALGVPIHTVDMGSDAASEHPAPGETKGDRAAARQALKDMSAVTGGKYFQAADAASLLQICRALDALEKSPIETPLYRKYHEAGVWFGVAGLVSWCFAWLLGVLFCPVFP